LVKLTLTGTYGIEDGQDIMFDLVADYPADAINCHDRITWPSLKEARERFSGLLVGGINEWQTLLKGPPAAIQDEIWDAVAQILMDE
jgi:uroporphyrinogen decarboxylase